MTALHFSLFIRLLRATLLSFALLCCLVPLPAHSLVGHSKLGLAESQLAVELYQKIVYRVQDSNRNLLFSPSAVFSALSLAYVRAQGRTKEQMQTVMHLEDFSNYM